jgi:hypothetical protein
MIDAILLATSIVATSTNSFAASAQSKGDGVVKVADGSYFIGYIQAFCIGSGTCENATSTNRGFNWELFFNYHHKK